MPRYYTEEHEWIDVDGDVADPGDGASGDRPLGLLTGGDVSPRASLGGTNGSASGDAPSAADASSLGLSAGRNTRRGTMTSRGGARQRQWQHLGY